MFGFVFGDAAVFAVWDERHCEVEVHASGKIEYHFDDVAGHVAVVGALARSVRVQE